MTDDAPLRLISPHDAQKVWPSLQQAFEEHPEIHLFALRPGGREFEVSYFGARYICSIAPSRAPVAMERKIMLTADLACARSFIEVSLASHVQTDPIIPAILAGLLGLAASIAEKLEILAVVWTPAYIASGPEFFARAATDFMAGGAFPALALVKFQAAGSNSVETSGLAWFCGQEVEISGSGLDEQALTKRLLRLVHDCVVNGPLEQDMVVAGMQNGEQITLVLQEQGSRIIAAISSDSDK